MLLYRELLKLGLSPQHVDEMFMWQLASLMSDDPTAAAPKSYSAGGVDPYIRARMEAAKAGEQQIAFVPVPSKTATGVVR